ncbi:MAG TPA: SET domain-containing protein [Acidimicrobiales bacterium]|nr:SET domain-containing protein [Acidimicrobiales bacterium]
MTDHLYIADSERHGRGVFARRWFSAGEVLESCPVLVVSGEEWDTLAQTSIGCHVFEWEEGVALALGHTSLLNHSTEPNAAYEMDYDGLQVAVRALRDIAPGEEITINYGGSPDAEVELWFDAV